jgi:hypothetical protein
MNKKNFLQQKYEELNRLKMLILDYPKEPVDISTPGVPFMSG